MTGKNRARFDLVIPYSLTFNAILVIVIVILSCAISGCGPKAPLTLADMYGHTCSKSMDQPGKDANPARGKINILLSPCVPENLVSRDGFSRPVPRQPAHLRTQDEIWCLLARFFTSSAVASIYLFKTTIHHRVSLEFYRVTHLRTVPIAFTAESPPAQGQ